jgi:hypothetical protein
LTNEKFSPPFRRKVDRTDAGIVDAFFAFIETAPAVRQKRQFCAWRTASATAIWRHPTWLKAIALDATP